jgi:hypothetical protein
MEFAVQNAPRGVRNLSNIFLTLLVTHGKSHLAMDDLYARVEDVLGNTTAENKKYVYIRAYIVLGSSSIVMLSSIDENISLLRRFANSKV